VSNRGVSIRLFVFVDVNDYSGSFIHEKKDTIPSNSFTVGILVALTDTLAIMEGVMK